MSDAKAAAAETVLEVHKRIELRAEPERVWRAVSDSAEIARWFSDEVRIDALEPGACGEFYWGNHGAFAFEVVSVERGEAVTWRWAREKDTPLADTDVTTVTFRVAADGAGGTILTVHETGFADTDAQADNDGGWDKELGELVALLDG